MVGYFVCYSRVNAWFVVAAVGAFKRTFARVRPHLIFNVAPLNELLSTKLVLKFFAQFSLVTQYDRNLRPWLAGGGLPEPLCGMLNKQRNYLMEYKNKKYLIGFEVVTKMKIYHCRTQCVDRNQRQRIQFFLIQKEWSGEMIWWKRRVPSKNNITVAIENMCLFMWLSDYKNKRIERRRMLGTGSIATCIAICLPPWHQNGVWSSWIKSYFPCFV